MENARKIRFSLTFLLMIYNIPEVLWMRRIVFSWELRVGGGVRSCFMTHFWHLLQYPVVSWQQNNDFVFIIFLQNKKLPDGKEKLDASEITFRKVNKHHAGTYVCTANNGFGQEVKEKIHLDVEFSPEVEVEEYFIHATETNQVELVCLVHAHPQATVQWFKNSIELTGDDVKLEKYGHKHTLTIPSVNHADYGNYTCRAKNVHGESAKNLEVSGKRHLSCP